MPNIKSAKKKMRKDIKKTKINLNYLRQIKKAIKSLIQTKGKEKKAKEQRKTYSLIDKAAKKKIIHKNKAARLKSKVMKLKK